MNCEARRGIILRTGQAAAVAGMLSVFAPSVHSQSIPDQRAEIVKAFAGNVDAEAMARYAASSFWVKLSQKDQARFVELFRQNLISLVADLLPPQIEGGDAMSTTTDLPGGDTLFRTMISLDGDRVPVGIRLRGAHIVDVTMRSASLMDMKRAEVTSLARRDGFPAVISELERRSGARAIDVAEAPVRAAQPVAPVAATDAAAIRRVVYFPAGSTQAEGANRVALKDVAKAASNPSTTITLIGYTDSTGSSEQNATLSIKRAESVAAALVAEGVSGQRIQVGGRGEALPSEAPLTEASRRRVEIAVNPTS